MSPLFLFLWMLLRAPLLITLHLTSAFFSLNSALLSRCCFFISEAVSGVRSAAEGAFQAASVVWAVHKPVSKGIKSPPPSWVVSEVWHDLFLVLFRGMRSVMNGTLLFALACNRHRLRLPPTLPTFIHTPHPTP